MSLRIGLFGGTFDPVHNGHVSIAESFLSSGEIDELWVLLTPYPPHKQEITSASYELRLKMLNAAFKGMNSLKISSIENELPKPSYSIQTIRALKKDHRNVSFYYCMGEDNLANFHEWRSFEDIMEECKLLVARRPGVTHEDVKPRILENTHFVSHTPLEISSTQIRKMVEREKEIRDLVPDKVLSIIENEQLYS